MRSGRWTAAAGLDCGQWVVQRRDGNRIITGKPCLNCRCDSCLLAAVLRRVFSVGGPILLGSHFIVAAHIDYRQDNRKTKLHLMNA
jgi:hypothetical protein